MCGIVGAVAQRDIAEILLEGLRRLEYRGYDSAGLAVVDRRGHMTRLRRLGKVANLAEAAEQQPLIGGTGIAHTRWATHGEPSEANAHPHVSEHIIIVHNGIIENHEPLREQMIARGYRFASETDTEVVAHGALGAETGRYAARSGTAGDPATARGVWHGDHGQPRSVGAGGCAFRQPAGDWPRRGRKLYRFRSAGAAAGDPPLYLPRRGDIAEITRREVTIIDRHGNRHSARRSNPMRSTMPATKAFTAITCRKRSTNSRTPSKTRWPAAFMTALLISANWALTRKRC